MKRSAFRPVAKKNKQAYSHEGKSQQNPGNVIPAKLGPVINFHRNSDFLSGFNASEGVIYNK